MRNLKRKAAILTVTLLAVNLTVYAGIIWLIIQGVKYLGWI